jgi:hypothetical protein
MTKKCYNLNDKIDFGIFALPVSKKNLKTRLLDDFNIQLKKSETNTQPHKKRNSKQTKHKKRKSKKLSRKKKKKK